MNMLRKHHEGAQPLSVEQRALARRGAQALASRRADDAPRLLMADGGEIPMPANAVDLLAEILQRLGDGQAVRVLTMDAEMSTQAAADCLNVSRPYLIGLLEAGVLPGRKVGAHRRIRAADVMAYKDAIEQAREKALDELAAQAQELGMGY